MATYEPTEELLREQLDSIRAQEMKRWHCFISDDCSSTRSFDRLTRLVGNDNRFSVARHDARRGFYHNFERALAAVPPHASFVALSDQDDRWHPTKLGALVDRLRDGDVVLAYCDMRTVTPEGLVLTDTYWHTRKNNFTDLASLIFANTVTGSAAVFRSSLLPLILPFPRQFPSSFHDHWIATVALALGQIEYVPCALQDYVQHENNVIGHAVRPPSVPLWRRGPFRSGWDRADYRAYLRATYEDDVTRIKTEAATALERLTGRLPSAQRKVLEHFATLDAGLSGLTWLGYRTLRGLINDDVTMGMERRVLVAVLWRWLQSGHHLRKTIEPSTTTEDR